MYAHVSGPGLSTPYNADHYSAEVNEFFPVGFVGSYAMDQDPPVMSRDPKFKEQQMMWNTMMAELNT